MVVADKTVPDPLPTQEPLTLEPPTTEPSTFLDTTPALLFAVSSILGLCNDNHKRILPTVQVDKVQQRIENLNLKLDYYSSAKNIEQFVKELFLILDCKEFIDASIKVKDKLVQDWFPFLNVLLYCSITLVLIPPMEENTTLNNSILQRLIPALAKVWKIVNDRMPECFDDGEWLQICWSIICELVIPMNDSIVSEYLNMSISLLSRLLWMYVPWIDSENIDYASFERNQFDIRSDPRFLIILKAGLNSSASTIRKQSVYILKQVVKFCTIYLQPPSNNSATQQMFHWKAAKRPQWSELWKQFFLLYESVQESQIHIVEPMLPLLKSLIIQKERDTPMLDVSWWEIIVNRALEGNTGNVRRLVIANILEMNLKEYPRLWGAKEFLFGTLMKALDNTSLYRSGDNAPSTESEFGMNVSKFYASYFEATPPDQLTDCTREYLDHIANQIRSATPILFFFQALLLLPHGHVLDMASLTRLKAFSRNNSLFHNTRARRIGRGQILQIFLNLSNPFILNFAEIASCLTEFLREPAEQFTINCREYEEISSWLRNNFDINYIDQNIALDAQQYFSTASDITVSSMINKSKEISTMLSLTLAKEGGFAQCVRPLYQHMALMASIETTPTFVIAGITLFVTLNNVIRDVSCNTADLMSNVDVSSRLYEWITVCEKLLLLPDNALELKALGMLLHGIRLFFSKATEKPDALITYLDILLYKLINFLSIFAQAATSQEAENYPLQLQKMIVFELISVSLESLEAMKTFHLGFTDPNTIERIFSCELEKPPRMTDAQVDEWDNLVVTFSVSKWSLIAILARFSRKSDELCNLVDIPTIFQLCTSALEAAKGKSVVAIFNCLRQLVSLPDFTISVDLIREAVMVSRVIIDEIANTPSWYFLYWEAFMDFFFQPTLLSREDIAGGMDSLAASVLDHLLHGMESSRKNIITRLARNLFSVWNSPQGRPCRLALQPYFTELLVYGPCREETEERLAQSLFRLSNHQDKDDGSDYLVRVYMNSILLHLDKDQVDDRHFALLILDDLLDSVSR